MLLDQGIVAVTGNGVEVEVEGFACAEIDTEAADGGVPAVHQFRPGAGVGANGSSAGATLCLSLQASVTWPATIRWEPLSGGSHCRPTPGR